MLFNFLSALTFLAGSLLAYVAAFRFDIAFLLPFAAGNFLYIGASDLVPEVNKHRDFVTNLVHFSCFVFGAVLMFVVKVLFHE